MPHRSAVLAEHASICEPRLSATAAPSISLIRRGLTNAVQGLPIARGPGDLHSTAASRVPRRFPILQRDTHSGAHAPDPPLAGKALPD